MPPRHASLQARLPVEHLGSTPTPYLHLPKINVPYNDAAQASPPAPASEAQTTRLAGKAKEDFAIAHEGPREKVAEPTKVLTHSPGGQVEKEVHTKHDNEAIARNKEKDQQMADWRNVEIGAARKFNTQSLAPVHLRPQEAPEVLRGSRGRHERQSGGEDRGR
jgi:hypothetical protein